MQVDAYHQKVKAIRAAGWAMSMPVRSLRIPARAANVLAMLELRTVGDVIEYGDDKLLAAHAFGPCSHAALKRAIVDLSI